MEEIMTSHNSPNELLNVWQSQKVGAIAMSVDELRRASNKLARRVFWRNTREAMAAAIGVAAYGYYFYEFRTPLLRLGSGLTVVGVLLTMFNLHRKGSAASMGKEMDSRSCLDFHRSELVRQRDLLASVWEWYLLPFVPGMSLFMVGLIQLTLSQPGAASRHGSIALGFAVVCGLMAAAFLIVWKLNKWEAGNLQKRIDELDAMKG
jgi:hypothetical protein